MHLMQLIPLRHLMPFRVRKLLRSPWSGVLQREQIWREKRFYRQFLQEGDLVFDVGAHTGTKTAAFLSLSARVVAVEPNPFCAEQIERKFRRAANEGQLHVEYVAAARFSGKIDLCVFDANPDLTSGSAQFASYVSEVVQETGRILQVNAVTLDDLIARFGVPTFLKIDVEGMDVDVLRGLTQRPRFLSFEYHTKSPLWENTLGCFSEAIRLGFVEANFTEMIRPELVLPKWLEISAAPSEMRRLLGNKDRWGDVLVR